MYDLNLHLHVIAITKIFSYFSFISLISVQILKPSADQKLLCAQNRICSSLPAICRRLRLHVQTQVITCADILLYRSVQKRQQRAVVHQK